jgi:putative transposase
MPQSLSRIILHIVFSTKNREPFLHDEIGKRMQAYLATVCRDCDAEAYRVGGVADHVHIACKLPRTITVSKLLETTKRESSKWIKKQGDGYKGFYWQGGYGAFSVSPSHLDPLIAYVENQAEHHRKETFQDEFRRLLKKYGIEYDERYVWD